MKKRMVGSCQLLSQVLDSVTVRRSIKFKEYECMLIEK